MEYMTVAGPMFYLVNAKTGSEQAVGQFGGLINQYAKQGWELVTIYPIDVTEDRGCIQGCSLFGGVRYVNTTYNMLVFKRNGGGQGTGQTFYGDGRAHLY